MPRFQDRQVKGVGQAEHGQAMRHLGKSLGGSGAHPLGRRVGSQQLRVLLLQTSQFLH